MKPNPNLLMLSALLCLGAGSPVSAQQVYKCWSKSAVVYSERPCSTRVVSTDQAPVPVKPNPKEVDLRRLEQNRVMARSLRPREGETAEQFETRRRRARLLAADRDECARIDVRMPVEEASMNNPDKAEVQKAEAALSASKKRFDDLGC
jgi:hypothetical protein